MSIPSPTSQLKNATDYWEVHFVADLAVDTGHQIESNNFLSLMDWVCLNCRHLTGLHSDSNMHIVEGLIASLVIYRVILLIIFPAMSMPQLWASQPYSSWSVHVVADSVRLITCSVVTSCLTWNELGPTANVAFGHCINMCIKMWGTQLCVLVMCIGWLFQLTIPHGTRRSHWYHNDCGVVVLGPFGIESNNIK